MKINGITNEINKMYGILTKPNQPLNELAEAGMYFLPFHPVLKRNTRSYIPEFTF